MDRDFSMSTAVGRPTKRRNNSRRQDGHGHVPITFRLLSMSFVSQLDSTREYCAYCTPGRRLIASGLNEALSSEGH